MKQHIEENASKQKPEPPLLHMVIRVKPLGGRPYWEKDLMKAMGLDGPVLVFSYSLTYNGPWCSSFLKSIK